MKREKFFSLYPALIKKRLKSLFLLPLLRHRARQIFRKKQFHASVAVLLLVVIVVNVLQPWSDEIAQGATYTFVQSSWSGGVSGDVPTHPTNQTSWTNFSTSTNAFTTGTSTVTIASSTYSSTDDGTFSSTGSATGGGFSNGVTSTVAVSGSGASAVIKLSGGVTTVNRVTVTSSNSGAGTPAFHGAAQMVGASGSDYLYMIEARNQNDFLRRYSISGNSWTDLAEYTYAYFGAQLLWEGTENYIYLARGQGTGFDRYSISGNSWSSMAAIPGALPTSITQTFAMRSSTEDYIYLFRGAGQTAFYRYSISGNSWTTLTAVSTTLDVGVQATREGDNIYLVTGNSTNFYRYSISGNSWSSMAALPTSITGANSGILHDVDTDYIYLLSYGKFYRYSISGNSWSTMATPTGVDPDYGSSLIHTAGEDTIYVTGVWDCCSAVRVWGYSISGNSWTGYHTVAGHSGGYGSPNKTAYRRPGDDYFYFLTANQDNELFKFTISQTTYNSSGNFTSAAMDLGVAKMNSFSWSSTTPSGVGSNSIQFQLAANNDNSTWNFVGPDGTSGTYFTTNGVTSFPSSLQGNLRYWKYKAYLSTADTSVTPVLNSVTFGYSSYAASGTLISSIYDTADPTNVVASIAWSEYEPTSTTVRFQLRTGASSSSVASATWMGPDGTASSYFTTYTGETTTSTMRDGSSDRYFQYKAFLDTTNASYTPTLSSVTVTYVVNAAPEIQNVQASQSATGTVSISYQARDSDTDTGTVNAGYVSSTFEYLDANGAYQTIPSSQLSAGANSFIAVDDVNWATSTVTWTVPAGLSIASSRIRVTINDNEAANNTTSTISGTFLIDSVSPASGAIVVDGSQVPAVVTLTATDSSSLYMKVSENSTLSDVSSWSALTATTSITLTTNPGTVYVQFKDAYNNTSSIFSATTPATPSSTIVQDISNVLNGATDYRLFVAWRVITTPVPGFANYRIYRSLDQTDWTPIATNTSINDNYTADSSISSNTIYYYKVKSTDSSGNVSVFSSIVNARANGDQDAGEGGGGTGVESEPIITSVATSSVGPTSVTITWNTDILANSQVGFSTISGNFTDNVLTVGGMFDNPSSVGQHNVVLGGLTPNTTYYFKVRSAAAGGAFSSSTNGGGGFIVRTLNGPVISGVSATEVHNTFARVVWTTSENANSYVIYSTSTDLSNPMVTSSILVFGTSHDLTLTGLTAGTNYYFYVQSANAGMITTTDKNIVSGVPEYFSLATTLDVTGPTISSIATTSVGNNSANVTWTTNESADSQIAFGTTTNYGTTTTLDSTFTSQHLVTLSGLASSTVYHFKILSRDRNNNLTESSDQIFQTAAAADTIAPTISSVATSSVTLTSFTATWTTNEVGSSIVEYGTNTSSYNSLAGTNSDSVTSHSVSVTGLSGNTTYYFRVRSADSAGNSATDSNGGAGWEVRTVADTTAPTISNISTLVNNTTTMITWTTNEAANSEINYGTVSSSLNSTASTSTLETSHAVTITGLTANTTYYFRVRSTDASSNIATDDNGGAAYNFTTLEAPGTTVIVITGGSSGQRTDRTPPVISGVEIGSITANSALITWRTDEPGNSLVRFGVSENYGTLVGNDLELLVSNHTVKMSNLRAAQTYHLKAITYDETGNRTESVDQVFTTLNIDGTEAPPSTSTEEIIEEEKPEQSPQTEQFISDALKKASSESLEKFLRDIAANPLLKDIPEDKFIQALLEMTSRVIEPPTIVGIKPTVEVQGTTAIIRWSTDKKSSSEINYAKENEYKPNDSIPYTNAAVSPDEFSINHSIKLTGLDPGVLYHFKVISKGLIGAPAMSGDYTFQTTGDLPVISDIRVTRPKDLQSSIVINWKTNVSTAGSVEYRSAKSGQSLTQGDSALLINHEVILKGLEGGVNYTLVLKGKDEFNNEVSSLPITFSTTLDQAEPTISKLSSESTLYPGKDSKVQTIISWETDEPATSQVFFQEGVAADKVTALPLDSSLNTRHIVVVTKFKPGTVYKYWVESKDLAGNSGKSEVFSILTPQEKETIVDIIINNFQSVFGWTKNIGI